MLYVIVLLRDNTKTLLKQLVRVLFYSTLVTEVTRADNSSLMDDVLLADAATIPAVPPVAVVPPGAHARTAGSPGVGTVAETGNH